MLGPLEPDLENEARNENSIVLKLSYGQMSFLLTDDAEDDQEAQLVDRYGEQLQSTILKAGHHGSSGSTSGGLLDTVGPHAVIVSSAYDSQYGHPSEVTLQRLADRLIPTYWTATHGDIVLVSNGQAVVVRTQQQALTEPPLLRDGSPIEPGSGDAASENEDTQLKRRPAAYAQSTRARVAATVWIQPDFGADNVKFQSKKVLTQSVYNTVMSRKSIKIRDSTHEQLSREKNESESWDEFLGRIIERSESISPEEAREAVREVIREDATTDMIRTEVRSVLAAELSDEMQKAVEDDPVKETVKSVVEDILSGRGVIASSLPVNQDAHDELVNVVKTAPSRGWMDRYFDMCQQLIELHDLERDDDLLVMSIRSDQNALPFSIGPRYVLKAYVSDEKIGVILPHGSTAVEELEGEATYKERFSGNDRPDPHYYKLPAPSADDFGIDGYEADWLQAVEHEVDRGHNRLRADAHKPVVYEAAVNLEYRKQLLDDAGLHEES